LFSGFNRIIHVAKGTGKLKMKNRMVIFRQRSKQVKQVMIHRLAIYRLKQEVRKQRKRRAVTRNKEEEEEHNPSHRKYAKKYNCTQSSRTKVTTGEYVR
jgi:hypothetical protein